MEPTTWGERLLAAVALMVSMGITFIAVDILTSGKMTRSLTGARALAEVIDFPGADDESA